MRTAILSGLVVLVVGCGSQPGDDSSDTAASGDSGELIETGAETGEETGEETGQETGEPLSPEEQQARDAYEALKSGLAEANLTNSEDLVTMAGFSAPNVFLGAMLPSLMVQTHISEYQSMGNTGLPACPALTGFSDSGEAELEWSAVGGCTDFSGAEWTGSFEQKMLDSVTVGLISKDFGERTLSSECEGKTDSFKFTSFIRMSGLGGESMELDILFTTEGENATASTGCESVSSGLGYDVDFVRVSEIIDDTEKTTYSHSGEVLSEDAGFQGYFNVQTQDEVMFESVCSTEALSGTTTLSNSSDTVVINYDGQTDCDDPGTVTWTLNGEPQGEVSGVGCASSERVPGTWMLAFGALALLIRRRED